MTVTFCEQHHVCILCMVCFEIKIGIRGSSGTEWSGSIQSIKIHCALLLLSYLMQTRQQNYIIINSIKATSSDRVEDGEADGESLFVEHSEA